MVVVPRIITNKTSLTCLKSASLFKPVNGASAKMVKQVDKAVTSLKNLGGTNKPFNPSKPSPVFKFSEKFSVLNNPFHVDKRVVR
mmetsp:Transcript_13868/g.16342  ORF Transcript_13868/g.16342 Transcript_13868/m.16342 type:complete len:85 (-) Transcript_13868:207-461(-)